MTVDRCTGLASGIYHYNPVAHQLHRLVGRTRSVERLLRDAQHAPALPSLPQVVIILASRFQRLSWKYRGMAYATTLKNVGVLYQTMYLVATAMGLAPCALGGGDSALFAEAVGRKQPGGNPRSVSSFLRARRPRGSDVGKVHGADRGPGRDQSRVPRTSARPAGGGTRGVPT